MEQRRRTLDGGGRRSLEAFPLFSWHKANAAKVSIDKVNY